MKLDLNAKVGIVLLLLTVSLLASHRAGLLDVSFDLLAEKRKFSLHKLTDGTSATVHEQDKNSIKASCTIDNLNGFRFCGVGLWLSGNGNGMSLERYDRISVEARVTSLIKDDKTNAVITNENHGLRVYFRNFNSEYSNLDDLQSLKFNGVSYQPVKNELTTIPFDYFNVEGWWLSEYQVKFKNAQFDVSNIVLVEFMSNNLNQEGQYLVEINQAVLRGALVSEATLLKWMLLIWCLAIFYLINRQRAGLKKVSITDSLTGLVNRRGINDWFSTRLNRDGLVLFYIDLDDFKKVNDSYGHLVGDELLCRFSEMVLATTKQDSQIDLHLFSRLSGDEFALVLKKADEDEVNRFAQALFEVFSKPLKLTSAMIKVNFSLGIAICETGQFDFNEYLNKADAAMYFAKEQGKNQYKIFDDHIQQNIIFRKNIAQHLHKAIEDDEFELVFQPMFYSHNLSMAGAEVLLRATSTELESIGPDVFIPIAEEYDIVVEIDMWVIEQTFIKIMQERNMLNSRSMLFCINISALELRNASFPKDFKKLLRKYEIEPNNIELEFTETRLIEADHNALNILKQLKALGVSLALDDFGTGHTSFNQLLNFPIDCLKIDKSFVSDLTVCSEMKTSMINAVISIAKSYKLKTVAEGVENIEQYLYLTHNGCEFMQGYYFSKPISWPELLKFMTQGQSEHLAMAASKVDIKTRFFQ